MIKGLTFKWRERQMHNYIVIPRDGVGSYCMRLKPSEAESYRLRGFTVKKVK